MDSVNLQKSVGLCTFMKFAKILHVKSKNSNHGSANMKEIIEKLDNLTKLIGEKDIIINDLVEKIKIIEEKLTRKEEVIVDNYWKN